jgi:hypothetical protein
MRCLHHPKDLPRGGVQYLTKPRLSTTNSLPALSLVYLVSVLVKFHPAETMEFFFPPYSLWVGRRLIAVLAVFGILALDPKGGPMRCP